MMDSKRSPINLEIIAQTGADPTELASHAALKCYQSKSPKMGKTINVESRLFSVGHHTTIQHHSSTSDIEKIAVGDITTGIHLVSPFYNSDQRSGRYCSKMFLEPNYDQINEYISFFWPEVSVRMRNKIIDYIAGGVNIFHKNIDQAVEFTRQFLVQERPFASEKIFQVDALKKIAQEQMRMFISLIFPTGLDFTVNLTALAAMFRSAWTPPMRDITSKMAKAVLKNHPDISYMFDQSSRRTRDWSIDLLDNSGLLFSPEVIVEGIDNDQSFVMPRFEDMHPVDLLHFMPEYMDNSIQDIRSVVEISMATMGQDQRHRTVRRGKPSFTGNFYLPAIPKACGLDQHALSYMEAWKSLRDEVPGTLFMVLAPYGAMVTYKKRGSFNAVAHEQIKRLCWCAQEEIYQVCRKMRGEIIAKVGVDSPVLQIFEPPCYRSGKCVEGDRYCGRDLRVRTPETYFPERKV